MAFIIFICQKIVLSHWYFSYTKGTHRNQSSFWIQSG